MAQHPGEREKKLIEWLRQDPTLPERLPPVQAAIIAAALDGTPVPLIAQDQRISEEAVWSILGDAARAVTGRTPSQPVVTGGMSSDTETESNPDMEDWGPGGGGE